MQDACFLLELGSWQGTAKRCINTVWRRCYRCLPLQLCFQGMRAAAALLSAQQASICLTLSYWVTCWSV